MLGFVFIMRMPVRRTWARASTTFSRRIPYQKSQNREINALSNGLQPASAHISAFQGLVGVENVLSDSFDIEKYTVDWTRVFKGGSVVCLPCSTEDVSNILRYCNDNRIGVVPQGGNTSLVGGSVGLFGDNGDQLIISMEKMKTIHSIEDSVLISDAGCILETLNTACVEKGYIVPLDLGAKGACMIGGNVATNAGGLRVLRYGTLHGNVLGLEVVQADGTVLDMLRTLKKDNCGYHLPHLFIGSEGTLGIITKVAIGLALKPTSTAVVWVKVSSFDMVSELLMRGKEEVGEILSAFEFLDAASIGAILKVSPHLLRRVQTSALPSIIDGHGGVSALEDEGKEENGDGDMRGIPGEICVLLEFSSSSRSRGTDIDSPDFRLATRLEAFLEGLLKDGFAVDVLMSQSAAQEKELWAIREDLPLCLMQLSRAHTSPASAATVKRCVKLYKYDVSIALRDTDAVVHMIKRQMEKEMQSGCGGVATDTQLEFCCFGHAGDQNLHLNVLLHVGFDPASSLLPGADYDPLIKVVQAMLDRTVFKAVLSVKGSVSAEHGVGQQKRQVMTVARSASELSLMSAIKRSLDPNGILNPGKLLPDGY